MQFNKLAIALLARINKRMAYLAIAIVVLSFLVQIPTSATHQCVPNFRTQMGLSSEGYPYKRYFCPEGYYPELKWGLERVYSNSFLELFVIILPLSLLVPVAIILIAPRLKSDDHGENAASGLRDEVQLTDQKIRQNKTPTEKDKD